MSSSLRIASRAFSPRVLSVRFPAVRYYAQGSYGNKQSGFEQGLDQTNPKSHLEHPGPESPAQQGSSSSSSASQSSKNASASSDSNDSTAKPAIHHPESASEENDPEVKKHNDEMRQRNEQSVNQLSEDDNKVPPTYWKGDVGKSEKPKDSK